MIRILKRKKRAVKHSYDKDPEKKKRAVKQSYKDPERKNACPSIVTIKKQKAKNQHQKKLY